MPHEHQAINVSDNPAMRQLVEDVFRTRQAKVLHLDSGEAVFVTPARSPRRAKARGTNVDELQQVLADTHGTWKGLVDPEEFKRQRQELQFDDRQPRSL